MSQRKNPDIEELLNSFIDGELTEKEHAEVQRLISDDEQVARRLRELRNSKMLVSSLPYAEAPAQILDGIKASLERGALSGEMAWTQKTSDTRVGVRHLMVRKVLTAAAMIGLVAILSGVIYTIVAPESDHGAAVPTVVFDGRLEIKTEASRTVNAFIDKTIEDNGLSDYVSLKSLGDRKVYSITCSRQDLNLLLSDLAGIWEKFDSSTLFVKARPPVKEAVVNNISAEQIANLVTPVKPGITSGDKEDEKPHTNAKLEKGMQVHLTIVVAGGE